MALEIIHYAALGKKGKVEDLLKEGVDVDAMNLSQETALFHAAKHGRLSVAKYLLHYGANPNRPNKDGVTPSIIAAWNNHKDCVKLLIQFNACWSNKVLSSQEEKLIENVKESEIHSYNSNQCENEDLLEEFDKFQFSLYEFTYIKNGRLRNGQKVTVKIYKYSSGDSAAKIASKEWEMLRSLRHANILLPYFKQETECDKAMLLVTEPVELGNLYHVINKTVGKISSAARFSLVKDIANGCNFLHKNSIIHNYLNSKSIYISFNWKVKIGNFEFSSKTTATVDVTPTFDVKSSYHISYTAPEAINQREFSCMTDIYSFGCLVWELLGQQTPWSWLSTEEVIAISKIRHTITLPSQPFWPDELKFIVNKCTNFHPEHRFDSFESIFYLLTHPSKLSKPESHDNVVIELQKSFAASDKECPNVETENRSCKSLNKVTFGSSHSCSKLQSSSTITRDPITSRKSILKNPASSLLFPTVQHNFVEFSEKCVAEHLSDCYCKPSRTSEDESKTKVDIEDIEDKDSGSELEIPILKNNHNTYPVYQAHKLASTANQHQRFLWSCQAEVIKDLEQLLSQYEEAGASKEMKIKVIKEYFALHNSPKHHHALCYSETVKTQVSDTLKKSKLLENVFELAATHQKKDWARTSILERDYMGYRCQDSSKTKQTV